jgi:putative ABC transport system permease protein
MSWYLRWRNVFRSEHLDDELDDELQYHLAETVDRLVAGGMSEMDARREARRRLGSYALQKERTRDMNVAAWLDETRADVVYGVRQLRSTPGFTTIAILSLALGIGANAAMFQLVNAIRLQRLPVQNPQELVSIDFGPGATRAGSWSSRSASVTWPVWDQIRAQQQAFTGVLAWSGTRFNLANGGEPRYAEGLYVSGDFFHHLGIRAVLGRTLTAQDDDRTCRAGAVLGYPFWQREFAGDPGVVGRTVSLDGHAFPVIGVTPPSFFGLEVGTRYDVAIPLCADRLLAADSPSRIEMPAGWWLSVMGRLKPGWTIQRATTHLHALSPGIMQATLPPGYQPALAKRYLANTLAATEGGTGTSALRQQYERPLWLLMATTGLVLLIACANLANLLLARAAVRRTEIAVRLAIGASRWRLVRQLLTESLLLAIAGGAIGVGVAVVLTRALIAFISTPGNAIAVEAPLDWRVLTFTATLAVLTCVLFGLLPALRATYLSPVSAMRSGSRSVTAGRERSGLRRALVATQVALSLVLLVGALLFTRTLHNLLTVDAGFQPEGILTVNIDISHGSYPRERRALVYRELTDRFSALAGVQSVAQVSFTPMSGGTWNNLVAPDGMAASVDGKISFFNSVGPSYFRTMGTRLLAGREFNDRDTFSAPKVAIVNETFARTFFGGANPVGHAFHRASDAGTPEPLFRIVGLVRDTKYFELREDFKPIAFFPAEQNEFAGSSAMFVLRIAGPPERALTSVKAAVAAMSPAIGIEFRPFSTQLQESLLREKLMATLSGGFGLLAGLLSTLGLYGVMAYMVAGRRNEIGVRMAFGANRAHVMRLVLREAILLLGIGLTAGVVLAWWAGSAAATLLFGLRGHDAVSLGAAGALLTTVALIASYLPARRAAALDPVAALRSE